jgi:hypothetical protein
MLMVPVSTSCKVLEGGRTNGRYVRHPVERLGHAADSQLHARVAERDGAFTRGGGGGALRSTIVSRDRA